jgi:hypothetical protein
MRFVDGTQFQKGILIPKKEVGKGLESRLLKQPYMPCTCASNRVRIFIHIRLT